MCLPMGHAPHLWQRHRLAAMQLSCPYEICPLSLGTWLMMQLHTCVCPPAHRHPVGLVWVTISFLGWGGWDWEMSSEIYFKELKRWHPLPCFCVSGTGDQCQSSVLIQT